MIARRDYYCLKVRTKGQNGDVFMPINLPAPRTTIALIDITRLKEASFADRSSMRLYKSLSDSLSDNEIISC